MRPPACALLLLALAVASGAAVPPALLAASGKPWVVMTIFETGGGTCSGTPPSHFNAFPAYGACLSVQGQHISTTCNSTHYTQLSYKNANCSGQASVTHIPLQDCRWSSYGYYTTTCDPNFALSTSLPKGAPVFATYVDADPPQCAGSVAFIEAFGPKVCFAGSQYWCSNTTEYQQEFKDEGCTLPKGKPIATPLACGGSTESYCNL